MQTDRDSFYGDVILDSVNDFCYVLNITALYNNNELIKLGLSANLLISIFAYYYEKYKSLF